MKFVHVIMALLFVITAALQLNDPDPLYWVTVYLAAGVVAVAAFRGRFLKTLSKVSIGLALAGLLISIPGTGEYFGADDYGSIYGGMSAEKPYIESAREFGGLFIAVAYLVFLEVAGRRRQS